MSTQNKSFVLVSVLAMVMSSAFASGAFAKEEGPCRQIREACTSAGFVKGQAKEGTGLWRDCIDPIMKGTPQPKKATKPLPSVDTSVVAACKAKRPNFGEGHRRDHKKPVEGQTSVQAQPSASAAK